MKHTKKKRKLPLMDIVLWAIALYLVFTVDFAAVDKFQQLLLMMYALCLVLRFGNVMKRKRKEFALRDQEQETAQQENSTATPSTEQTSNSIPETSSEEKQ